MEKQKIDGKCELSHQFMEDKKHSQKQFAKQFSSYAFNKHSVRVNKILKAGSLEGGKKIN